MKKNSLNSVFRAFTLAEALVALLVITIIIAASLPTITKKKRSIDRVTHGAYACYWQNGQLIGRYLIDQKTAVGKTYYDNTEGRYGCEFTPPAGAKNFVVTTVGGGGGGAATGDEAQEANQVFEQTGSTSYKVPFTGDYKMLIVGGGGGGGRSYQQYWMNSKITRRACTGTQAGMVYISSVNLQKDDSLTIKVGYGGSASTDYYRPGSSGSESYVYNRNGLIARADGGGGGCSYKAGIKIADRGITGFNASGGGQTAGKAFGGQSFPSIKPANFVNSLNTFYSNTAGSYSINTSNASKPRGTGYSGKRSEPNNYYYHQNDYYDMQPITRLESYESEFGIDFNRYVRTNYDANCNGRSAMYGCGNLYNFNGAGGGGEGQINGGAFDFGYAKGGDGIVIIKGSPLYPGKGGYAAEVKQTPFASLPAKTLLFPGKGGAGGYIEPKRRSSITGTRYVPSTVAPKEGESSYIKNYSKAEGGKPAPIVNMSDNNTINNEQSVYGAMGGSGEVANIAPTYKQKGGAGGYSDKDHNGYTTNNTIHGLSRPLFANGREIDTFNNLIGAGAGGGGGTATGKTYTTSDASSQAKMQTFIDANLGKGGDGTSGIVFIQW